MTTSPSLLRPGGAGKSSHWFPRCSLGLEQVEEMVPQIQRSAVLSNSSLAIPPEKDTTHLGWLGPVIFSGSGREWGQLTSLGAQGSELPWEDWLTR